MPRWVTRSVNRMDRMHAGRGKPHLTASTHVQTGFIHCRNVTRMRRQGRLPSEVPRVWGRAIEWSAHACPSIGVLEEFGVRCPAASAFWWMDLGGIGGRSLPGPAALGGRRHRRGSKGPQLPYTAGMRFLLRSRNRVKHSNSACQRGQTVSSVVSATAPGCVASQGARQQKMELRVACTHRDDRGHALSMPGATVELREACTPRTTVAPLALLSPDSSESHWTACGSEQLCLDQAARCFVVMHGTCLVLVGILDGTFGPYLACTIGHLHRIWHDGTFGSDVTNSLMEHSR
jgi:hypothetical protein